MKKIASTRFSKHFASLVVIINLEKEQSSDEESSNKKYLKEIENKANSKKMAHIKSTFVSKTITASKKGEKKYKEDEGSSSPVKHSKQVEEEKHEKGKFGIKAIRKVLRKLTSNLAKKDMQSMIWVILYNSRSLMKILMDIFLKLNLTKCTNVALLMKRNKSRRSFIT